VIGDESVERCGTPISPTVSTYLAIAHKVKGASAGKPLVGWRTAAGLKAPSGVTGKSCSSREKRAPGRGGGFKGIVVQSKGSGREGHRRKARTAGRFRQGRENLPKETDVLTKTIERGGNGGLSEVKLERG